MRLWHWKLLDHLPKSHLFVQHRICCVARGRRWDKGLSGLKYVFARKYDLLYAYHCLVIAILSREHGVKVPVEWLDPYYQGKTLGYNQDQDFYTGLWEHYPEHDEDYYNECVEELKKEGVELDVSRL